VDGRHLWSESTVTQIRQNEPCMVVSRCKADIIQLYRRITMKPEALDATATGWVPFTTTDECNGDNKLELVLLFRINPVLTLERNRKGVRTLDCIEIIGIHEYCQRELKDLVKEDQLNNPLGHPNNDDLTDMDQNLQHKSTRQMLFAKWILKTFSRDTLNRGILDVAGGNGELSQALSELSVKSILLDPNPRCCSDDNNNLPFEVIAEPLQGDSSDLTDRQDSFGERIRTCGLIAGMHPDQATDAIIDTALHIGTSFAILPCCVMPKLFPNRIQKRSGHPVRSYNTFCQYLQDKAPAPEAVFQVDYLPFLGRNKIIYYKSPKSCDTSDS